MVYFIKGFVMKSTIIGIALFPMSGAFPQPSAQIKEALAGGQVSDPCL
jgi:hypothetical protein